MPCVHIPGNTFFKYLTFKNKIQIDKNFTFFEKTTNILKKNFS